MPCWSSSPGADYKAGALETIRSATAIVAEKALAELPDFRAFLIEIAAAVADANEEGGFLGIGAQAQTREEAAAMEAVRGSGSNGGISNGYASDLRRLCARAERLAPVVR